jgi:8-oxo-dGTP diphosphatase
MSGKTDYSYAYPHPALTADAVIFSFTGNELKVLLIQRTDEPFKKRWAFPGGFVNENETVENAVERELREETSLTVDQFTQFYFASAPGRDPRGWTVSCCFMAFVNWDNAAVKAGDDAANTSWFPLFNIPSLAFDHDQIFLKAREYLKKIVRFSVINSELLPGVFLLEQIHSIYFQITGKREESDILLQRLIDSRIIVPHTYRDLYTFHKDNYIRIRRYGFV